MIQPAIQLAIWKQAKLLKRLVAPTRVERVTCGLEVPLRKSQSQ